MRERALVNKMDGKEENEDGLRRDPACEPDNMPRLATGEVMETQ